MEAQGSGSAKKTRAARGVWSAQQRQEILDASMAPDAVLDEVAQRFGVRVALIGSWRRRARRAAQDARKPTSAPRFAAVRVDSGNSDHVIEIDLDNRCIRVRGIVDAAMLREVLAATR